MFKIGDKIVNRSGKVCEIVNIEEADYGVGMKTYYVLSPCFTNNDSLVLHTPIEQESTLRKVMNKEEVETLISSIPNIDVIRITNPKIRKTKFKELYTSGEPKEILRLIKSFMKKKDEFKNDKKTLSFTDENFLTEIKTNLYYEISLVLGLDFNQVDSLITNKLI